MAPDLNSVPPSPRRPHSVQSNSELNSPSTSRRVSQTMGPPPMPNSFLSTGSVPPADMPAGGTIDHGPGPIRHPRPMTAADLHLLLEKEQEAVVNRLTRELTLLRQQTASVASTASSTSTGFNEPLDGQFHHPIPTSSRRHRSSSSLSSHLAPGSSTLAASVASIAPSRDTAHPASSVRSPGDCMRAGRSRASSITSSRQQQYNGESFRSASISSTTRQEDASHQRAELESLRRENEMLRRRIQELEQSLRSYREGQTG
ncbi:hypothetical protein VTN31DRAFT_4190 [Thermomyces dupontii]|uniref:uncharacterized protein n=1 Tax=Talaromyces thermophilus TaxID=28565 RepID=UPI0037431654